MTTLREAARTVRAYDETRARIHGHGVSDTCQHCESRALTIPADEAMREVYLKVITDALGLLAPIAKGDG